jgi:cell filamentation protein
LEASTFDKVYCYPGTEVLINNFNEHDPRVLSQYERMYTGARIIDLFKKPIQGKFDLSHLKAIHKYIFQDIYPWAGELRLVNISKEILFCDAQFIEKTISKVFDKLAQENYLRDCSEKNIAEKAAYYLGEINAVHPFREGNGRAQREFVRELLLPLGFKVDYSLCDPKMMLYASINAFAGDYELMTELFDKCIIAKPQN